MNEAAQKNAKWHFCNSSFPLFHLTNISYTRGFCISVDARWQCWDFPFFWMHCISASHKQADRWLGNIHKKWITKRGSHCVLSVPTFLLRTASPLHDWGSSVSYHFVFGILLTWTLKIIIGLCLIGLCCNEYDDAVMPCGETHSIAVIIQSLWFASRQYA